MAHHLRHRLNLLSSSFLFHLAITFAPVRATFWSQNVANGMPPSISTKLSPLTRLDSDHYAAAISRDTFKADPQFCALAGLACVTGGTRVINTVKQAYAETKVYNNNKRDPSPLEKPDPFSFFRLSALEVGNSIRLPNLKESLPRRSFLPAQIASQISLSAIGGVSRIFPDSDTNAIETTLALCNAKNIKGEFKSCPKSLEEMVTFSKTTLHARKLLVLTSESTRGSGNELIIKRLKMFDSRNIVACHEMFLPFAAYFCHFLPSTRVYSADLVETGTDGTRVNKVVAVCHMDTSGWPADHVAFRVLKFGPGQGEACHWMNQLDVVWVGV